MDNNLPPIKVFAGEASHYLGESICKELGIELGKMKKDVFADGEFEVAFEESIRGSEVYLVQSTFPNSDNLMELLLMIDAAKRASAGSIIAVLPYFGWARQDRKDKPRVSIAAKLVADLLQAAGITRMITMDLHADQIQGFFNVPVDHLYASSIFIPYINSLKLENMVIASPDVGGAKRANSYAKYFDVPLVLCHKTRAKANVIATMTVIGDVKDKNVILVDDIVDTAGTISKSANLLLENGAKSVRALCSHPVMSNPATERIIESGLNEIIFTDSIPYTKENPKATVLPVAKLFADTIRRIHNNQSISSQYLFK
ncbi:MAG: ribose-phosphate pyrophosphokinase [Muribaculaceae bacterium]|nr:ribose-phosphate pyrophosphokinase [Muribaculaceae bacterium]